ncbi:hypothetical protein JCM5353_001002 [Sporobolomyces roseus]
MPPPPPIHDPHNSRHLLPEEQAALIAAEERVDQDLMEEPHEATQRGLTLNRELAKIVYLALQNKDDKVTLEAWAHRFEQLFRDAGKTTFTLDSIMMRLDEVDEEVKKGVKMTEWSYRSLKYHVLSSFEPFVLIGGKRVTTGIGMLNEEIEGGITELERKIDIKIRDG